MKFFKSLGGVPDSFFSLFESRDALIGAKYVVQGNLEELLDRDI